MATYTLRYLESCNSQYFQGFGGQTYAVPLSPRPRNSEVLSDLLTEIRSVELFDENNESAPEDAYVSLRQQAVEMFSEVDGRKRFSQFEFGEECYAYFGVIVEGDRE